MRAIVLSLLMVMATTMASAQELAMKDVFAVMPDSILPYLSRNNRLDMIDFMESNMNAVVDNALGGKSRLDTLTSDYLHLTLNESVTVEMKLLKSDRLLDDTTKTIVGLSTTYANVESRIEFFTSKWHSVDIPLVYDNANLMARSDTMSQATYGELSRLAGEHYVVASLSPISTNIELTPTFPTLNAEDRQKMETIKRKIVLIYDVSSLKFLNK